MRRYDIDWLRVIAIGLLLIYHVAIGFQPWGMMIGFITSPTSWTGLWLPMTLLNVWRIPLLFFVSGMGVYFAMQQRTWKELITERMLRIALPFVFGMFAIVPLHVYILRDYYNLPPVYAWGPGHLWFLRNIFAYVILLSPVLFYLKKNESHRIVLFVKYVFSKPWGLLVVAAAFVAEVVIIKPVPFELYAMTWHGFVIGLLAFFFGFCFVLSGEAFWNMIQKGRWFFLALATAFFALRVWYYTAPGYCLAIESVSWIITVLAFGSKYLNKPGNVLTYLSAAAYPVYMLHMIFLYLGSWLIFKLSIHVYLQFGLVVLFTAGGCLATYEIIRRIKWVRPLFGLKMD